MISCLNMYFQLKSGDNYIIMKPLIQVIFARNVSKDLKISNDFLRHFHILSENGECYHRNDFHIYLIQVHKLAKEGYNENIRLLRLMSIRNKPNSRGKCS